MSKLLAPEIYSLVHTSSIKNKMNLQDKEMWKFYEIQDQKLYNVARYAMRCVGKYEIS